MENNEKVMTGEESLHIITDMINKTKVNISQSSFHLLFWGWLIFACSLSEFVLWKFTSFSNPWYVWFFVVPGVFVSLIYGFIKGKKNPSLPLPQSCMYGHGWGSCSHRSSCSSYTLNRWKA